MHHVGHLVEGDERLTVFGVTANDETDPTVVHRETLIRCISDLKSIVDIVIFVDDAATDAATLQTINDMIGSLGSDDAVASFEPVAEAIKVCRQGVVERGLDRSELVVLRLPEVVRRSALVSALAARSVEGEWIDPASLIAECGGQVSIYPKGWVNR